MFDSIVYAAENIVGKTDPTWFEHVDLMQVLLVAAIGYIVWSVRTERQALLDSLHDLYEKYNTLNGEFNKLKGEHSAACRFSIHNNVSSDKP